MCSGALFTVYGQYIQIHVLLYCCTVKAEEDQLTGTGSGQCLLSEAKANDHVGTACSEI